MQTIPKNPKMQLWGGRVFGHYRIPLGRFGRKEEAVQLDTCDADTPGARRMRDIICIDRGDNFCKLCRI